MIASKGTLCASKVVIESLYAFQYQYFIGFFLVAHQLLFCAVNVPEKYATGLISLSLLIDLSLSLSLLLCYSHTQH